MSDNPTAVSDDLAPTTPDPDDGANDDLATLLRRREHARPNRITYVLLTLLVLTVGFVGGAVAQQRFGSAAASTTAFAGLPDGLPAGMTGGLPGGAAVPGAGAAGMTVGTVKLVDGRNLYVTTTSGETVKVTVPDTAAVTSQAAVTLADLASGDTVLVRGDTGDDGTVTATSVSAGALPTPTPTQGDN